MTTGENKVSLPTDLIMEIFSRLPFKSIMRFRCLSKLWGSILRRPYFNDLFLTRSSARPPRLLFALNGKGDEWRFFTSPQHQYPYEKSSLPLVVTAGCRMKLLGDLNWGDFSGHASGLFLFCRNLYTLKEDYVICNPSTGQFATLPLPKERMTINYSLWSPFLGFDPINREFKVLSISHPLSDEIQILTLGTGNDSWRKIHCPLEHSPRSYFPDGVCINGGLYYLAKQPNGRPSMIVCFDFRSEKFEFIHRDFRGDGLSYLTDIKLINYKGTLGVVTWEPNIYTDSMRLWLWIMKDVENPESEWLEYVCNFKKQDVDGNVSTGRDWHWDHHFFNCFCIVGVTATGDIVLSRKYTDRYEPFHVGYINPERNTFQIVEIQGLGPLGDHNVVRVFIDYVEDLKFINMMTR